MVKIDGGGRTIFLNLLWSQCPGIKMDRIRTVHAEHRLQDVLITVAALRKRSAGFKASDFSIQELRTAIRQVMKLWFIPEISSSKSNFNWDHVSKFANQWIVSLGFQKTRHRQDIVYKMIWDLWSKWGNSLLRWSWGRGIQSLSLLRCWRSQGNRRTGPVNKYDLVKKIGHNEFFRGMGQRLKRGSWNVWSCS